MYKSILAILLVGLLAAPAMAVPPPAYDGDPYGWGNSPLEWERSFGECAMAGCWNPEYNNGNGGWNPCFGGEIFACEFTVELWIELYATMTVEGLFQQFHTVADNRDGDRFDFYICGTIQSNHPETICLIPGYNFDLGYLQFIEDVVGEDNGEVDIPLNWAYAYGQGDPIPCDQIENWTRAYPNPMICIDIPRNCDWWWCYWGWFVVEYHANDGYYTLLFAICPTPRM